MKTEGVAKSAILYPFAALPGKMIYMLPLVKKLEEKLLPEFEEIATKIRQEIPGVRIVVSSFPLGSDEYLAHVYAISCIFTSSCGSEADLVDLCVDLSRLVSVPGISANVCWGHPSGFVEAEFPEYVKGSENNSLIVSGKALDDLYKDLPRLYDALFAALKRRKPLDE